MREERARGHLDLLLLAALAEGPGHGYAIIESIRAKSGHIVDLPEGSVYPALHRLERQGVTKSTWSQAPGRPRRVYKLTRRGWAELARQRAEWRSFARAINAIAGT